MAMIEFDTADQTVTVTVEIWVDNPMPIHDFAIISGAMAEEIDDVLYELMSFLETLVQKRLWIITYGDTSSRLDYDNRDIWVEMKENVITSALEVAVPLPIKALPIDKIAEKCYSEDIVLLDGKPVGQNAEEYLKRLPTE